MLPTNEHCLVSHRFPGLHRLPGTQDTGSFRDHCCRSTASRLFSGLDIAEVAATLGYASQSAFGTAFKRIKGCSPKVATRRPARSAGERNSGSVPKPFRSR
ncbi:helix-turn-helix domain-containing protein [Rhizobium sp. NXC24]|uniref:helix-turn-helix domain-containing protein n=1 Tax=Rhizobium sp. NXC24 TaxID=2048897 RepID=UPI000CF1E4D4|nr:helix-turn-helix domain-containing protein [Rhizobium sp. NXC24]